MPGFFSFQSLVSTDIIKAIYAAGMIILTLLSGILIITGLAMLNGRAFADPTLNALLASGDPAWKIISGLFLLILGNLVWRLVCEVWILFFSIHEILADIKTEIEKRPYSQ